MTSGNLPIPAADAPLRSLPVADAPLRSVSATDAPLRSVTAADAPLRSVPAADAPLRSVPVIDAPLQSGPAADAPFRSVPATDVPSRSVPAADAPLRSVSAGNTLVLDVLLLFRCLRVVKLMDSVAVFRAVLRTIASFSRSVVTYAGVLFVSRAGLIWCRVRYRNMVPCVPCGELLSRSQITALVGRTCSHP